jgi:hypothetical protein
VYCSQPTVLPNQPTNYPTVSQALNFPNHPAVVIFNYWSPWLGKGYFWENAESDFAEYSW